MSQIESQIRALEKSLIGSANFDEDEKKSTRMAIVKQAMSEMDEDERKEARTAMDDMDHKSDEKPKEGMTDEKPEDKPKEGAADEKPDGAPEDKSKEGMSEDKEKDDLKAQVATLTATVTEIKAKPYMDKMLDARSKAGMTLEQIENFRKTLAAKTISEVKERYEEDAVLLGKTTEIAREAIDPMPFNGQALTASGEDNVLLEELFA